MRKTNTDPASILNVFALVIVFATGARGAESDTEMDPLLKPEILAERCKGCMVCVAQCPPHAIEAIPEQLAQQQDTGQEASS